MKRSTVLIPVLLATLGASEAMAIEEPSYEVVSRHEGWELRRYDPYLVAETEVEADFEDAGRAAFRILADYIFGKNLSSEKIGMTAPVSQRAEGEKIGMTAPVAQYRRADRFVVAFAMPARYDRESLPAPVDPRITIREVPARLVAARTYTGTWSTERYRENARFLDEALEGQALEPAGEPVWARFNSPFSLWFMRRNEIQVPVTSR